MDNDNLNQRQNQESTDAMTITYENLSDGLSSSSLSPSENQSVEHERGPWPAFEWIFLSPLSVAPVSKAATAQAMDSVAKGVMHASAAFFGPALLQFAFDQVQEQQNDCSSANNDGDDVDGSNTCDLLWGFWRPSAVLTTSSVISVFSASIGIPFLGAYIDRQRYDLSQDHGRFTAGRVTAYCLAFIHLAQMFVHSSTWFFFWISHTIAEALNMVHQM